MKSYVFMCVRPVVFLAHHHRLTAIVVAMLLLEIVLSKVLT